MTGRKTQNVTSGFDSLVADSRVELRFRRILSRLFLWLVPEHGLGAIRGGRFTPGISRHAISLEGNTTTGQSTVCSQVQESWLQIDS